MRLAHIKILCNNSTAVACINKFGTSHSGKCDTLSKQIWKWAQEHENWLSVTNILGIKNTQADLRMRSIPRGNVFSSIDKHRQYICSLDKTCKFNR